MDISIDTYDDAQYKYLKILDIAINKGKKYLNYASNLDKSFVELDINLFTNIIGQDEKGNENVYKLHELHYGPLINNTSSNKNYWTNFTKRNRKIFNRYCKKNDNISTFQMKQWSMYHRGARLIDCSSIEIDNDKKYYKTKILLCTQEYIKNNKIKITWSNYHTLPTTKNIYSSDEFIIKPYYPYLYPCVHKKHDNTCMPTSNTNIRKDIYELQVGNFTKACYANNYSKSGSGLRFILKNRNNTQKINNIIDDAIDDVINETTNDINKTINNVIESIDDKKTNDTVLNKKSDGILYDDFLNELLEM
jgi:hypothetical protein